MYRLASSRWLRIAGVFAATLAFSACAMTWNTRTLGVPVTMAGEPGEAMAGDSFRINTKAVHVLWGLIPARQPNLQQTLAGQLGTGGGVRNLTIRSRKRLSDLLVTGLTIGLLSPTTVTFEGVVVPGSP